MNRCKHPDLRPSSLLPGRDYCPDCKRIIERTEPALSTFIIEEMYVGRVEAESKDAAEELAVDGDPRIQWFVSERDIYEEVSDQ